MNNQSTFNYTKNRIALVLQIAYEKNVLRRAIVIGIIVGSILNIINQGNILLSFNFADLNITKLLFTYTVPYFVSTISSVLSIFLLKSGNISLINGEIQCSSCLNTTTKIYKGEIVPFCNKCKKQSTWKLIQTIDSTDKELMDKTYSMALFAEKNPSPIFRFGMNKTILESNEAANNLFSRNSLKDSNIEDLLPCLKNINLDSIITNSKQTYFVENINNRQFHFKLTGLADLGIGQVYGSDITKVVNKELKFPVFETLIIN